MYFTCTSESLTVVYFIWVSVVEIERLIYQIEVNGEMDALEKMLSQCYEALNTGGRLVVLSYHSLEDRLVKNFIKTNNASGEVEKDMFGRSTIYYKAINKKVIVATEEEQKINPRSRSAKLRIAERIN